MILFQHLYKFFLHLFVDVAVACEGFGAIGVTGKEADKIQILHLLVQVADEAAAYKM